MNLYQTSSSGLVPIAKQTGMPGEGVAPTVCEPWVGVQFSFTERLMAAEQSSLEGGSGVALTQIENYPEEVPDPTPL